MVRQVFSGDLSLNCLSGYNIAQIESIIKLELQESHEILEEIINERKKTSGIRETLSSLSEEHDWKKWEKILKLEEESLYNRFNNNIIPNYEISSTFIAETPAKQLDKYYKNQTKEEYFPKSRMNYKSPPFNLPILDKYFTLAQAFKQIIKSGNFQKTYPNIVKWFQRISNKLTNLEAYYYSLVEKKRWFDRLRYYLSCDPAVAQSELWTWFEETSKCPKEIRKRLAKYKNYLFTYVDFPGLDRHTSAIERANGKVQRKSHKQYNHCSQILDVSGEISSLAYASKFDCDLPLPIVKNGSNPVIRKSYKRNMLRMKELRKIRSKKLKIDRLISTRDGKALILGELKALID